jgi:C_GCAxxG_C_C family probable redox protein
MGSVNYPERALLHFNAGFNCAESVLMAVEEWMHPDGLRSQPLATAFGGGIARQGCVCGCLSGAAMAVGLAVGRVEASDQSSKELVYEIVGRIFDEVRGRLHAVECRELTGVDFSTEEAIRDGLLKVHDKVCCPLVSFVTQLTIAELKARGLPARSERST